MLSHGLQGSRHYCKGLADIGAPSRIRTCAHGSGDHGWLGRYTCRALRNMPSADLELDALSLLSREPGAWWRPDCDSAGQHGYVGSGRPDLLLILSSGV